MMILAIHNHKGGVGTTTLAACTRSSVARRTSPATASPV